MGSSKNRRNRTMNMVNLPHMILPSAPDLERALIAGLISSPEDIVPIADMVAADDLLSADLSSLFSLMLEMRRSRDPVDLITLSLKVTADDDMMSVAQLCDIARDAPVSSSLPYYARQIRGIAAARELYSGATRMMSELGSDPIGNLPAALIAVTETVSAAGKRLNRGDHMSAVHITEYLPKLFDEIEERATKQDSRVWTGFNGLDNLLEGSQAGHMVLIAARPAMGKSSLALNIADMAAATGTPSIFISLEMTRLEVATRLVASRGSITLSELRQRELSEEQWNQLELIQDAIGDLPLYIEDRPSLTLPELIEEVRKLVQNDGVKLVVIDYLQLLRMGTRQMDRYQEVSEISRALKIAAMELGIVVIALCQLNRGLESRKDKRPILSDLRESGSLEQDADAVCMLYRGHIYDETEPESLAEIIVRKNRHGRTGSVEVQWIGKHTRFDNVRTP